MRRALSAVAAVLLSCGGGNGGTHPAGGPTFYRDVEPIVQTRCQGCHVEGGIAPFPLVSYDEVRARAALVARAVEERIMPPWPPSARGLPLLHDRSLAQDEIDTLVTWARLGAPSGSSDDHAERRPDVPAIRADLEVAIPAPYLPRSDVADDYRCFAVDPGVRDAGRFVTGVDVVPGQPEAVHHVILFIVEDEPRARARLEALDAADPGAGYACFGGSGLEDLRGSGGLPLVRMLGGWAPGSGASPMPAGTGIALPARARVVMQVHYHGAGVRAADQTRARLELATAPVEEAVLLPLTNDSFVVPPGAKDVAVEATAAVAPLLPPSAPELTARVHGVFPHMHLRGSSIAVSAVVGGREILLVEIPRWDFHWQGGYTFREPVRVGAGDELRLRCVYDNSPENQPIVDGARQPPHELRWGEGTDDEMCLAFVHISP